jgi:hypothetical protein
LTLQIKVKGKTKKFLKKDFDNYKKSYMVCLVQ